MSKSFTVKVDGYVTADRLAWALSKADVLEPTANVELAFGSKAFMRPSGIAFLAQWARRHAAGGFALKFTGSSSVLAYLERMNLFEWAGAPATVRSISRRPEVGRFIPILGLGDTNDVTQAHNAICDLLLGQFDDGQRLLAAMEWCVYEVLDNVLNHAEVSFPAAVCAQPAAGRLEICVADFGRGLRRSLEEAHSVADHRSAISLALTRGITRGAGQGNGLAGTDTIVRANGGSLRLWTGDALWKCKDGVTSWDTVPAVPGTGVALELRLDRPVKLADTWIGERDWGFLNAEAERLAGADGLRVAEQCANTGTRDAARTLRRRLTALLSEAEEPLTLDFNGVRAASSSFLDELLAPLRDKLGDDFGRRVQLRGMSETIRRIANGVVAQRFEGIAPTPIASAPKREAEAAEWLLTWRSVEVFRAMVVARSAEEAHERALELAEEVDDHPFEMEERENPGGQEITAMFVDVPTDGGSVRVDIEPDASGFADSWVLRPLHRPPLVKAKGLAPVMVGPGGQDLYSVDSLASALGVPEGTFFYRRMGKQVPRTRWVTPGGFGLLDLYTAEQMEAILGAYDKTGLRSKKVPAEAFRQQLQSLGLDWLPDGGTAEVLGGSVEANPPPDTRSKSSRWIASWRTEVEHRVVLPGSTEKVARSRAADVDPIIDGTLERWADGQLVLPADVSVRGVTVTFLTSTSLADATTTCEVAPCW